MLDQAWKDVYGTNNGEGPNSRSRRFRQRFTERYSSQNNTGQQVALLELKNGEGGESGTPVYCLRPEGNELPEGEARGRWLPGTVDSYKLLNGNPEDSGAPAYSYRVLLNDEREGMRDVHQRRVLDRAGYQELARAKRDEPGDAGTDGDSMNLLSTASAMASSHGGAGATDAEGANERREAATDAGGRDVKRQKLYYA